MVLLVTSDNEQFQTDRDIAERSVLIKNMLEGLSFLIKPVSYHSFSPYTDVGESDQPIPLPNVSSSVLKKVLEYCEHHRGEPLPAPDADQNQDETRKRTTDISEWDQKFITVDQEMLFEIILAANYLDIKPLLDVGCKTVANMIKGKTPEEIRKLFNIVNDFTPEEEPEAYLILCNLSFSASALSSSVLVAPGMPVIPDIPGILVQRNSEQESWLKAHVAKICHMDRPK
ncbi:hypothetical protein H0H93_010685 [Arthromyces matolae]|nr:hypothetical protein H0H93_010685 [Arthromyces matolae]